jgi:hypothetical protein
VIAMGFEQITEQATNRLFIVYDQDVAVVEQRGLAGFHCDREDAHTRPLIRFNRSEGIRLRSVSATWVKL